MSKKAPLLKRHSLCLAEAPLQGLQRFHFEAKRFEVPRFGLAPSVGSQEIELLDDSTSENGELC